MAFYIKRWTSIDWPPRSINGEPWWTTILEPTNKRWCPMSKYTSTRCYYRWTTKNKMSHELMVCVAHRAGFICTSSWYPSYMYRWRGKSSFQGALPLGWDISNSWADILEIKTIPKRRRKNQPQINGWYKSSQPIIGGCYASLGIQLLMNGSFGIPYSGIHWCAILFAVHWLWDYSFCVGSAGIQ